MAGTVVCPTGQLLPNPDGIPDKWWDPGESPGPHSLVGVAGFEPTTSSSRTKRATKLRHTPTCRLRQPAGVYPPLIPAALPRSSTYSRPTSVSSVASGGRQSNWCLIGLVPSGITCSHEFL